MELVLHTWAVSPSASGLNCWVHFMATSRYLGDLREALPTDPLPHQSYFHGGISRVEAEALLEADGDFLVRESSKRVGQYVLTGLASGQPQHLLLVDRQGKVSESVP